MFTAKGHLRPFFLFDEHEMKNYFLTLLKKLLKYAFLISQINPGA